MGTRGRDSGGESCSMRLAGGGKVGAGVAERDRALQRSLMYGLIWASTVATARLVGPGFTKLMAHIKTAEKFRFMLPTGPRGESKDSIFFHFWLVPSFYAFIKPRAAVSVAFFIEGGWDFLFLSLVPIVKTLQQNHYMFFGFFFLTAEH